MVLDPSAYIAGLNRAAQHTANFQSSIQAGTAGINAFGKASQSMAVGMSRLNGSVYASMTAFYALSRVVSSSLGVFEEYNNIISRISATADLSIDSVTALSESFKKLNRELGGSRTDLMKGVYRAVQANFTTPEEFMPIGAAAMRLRTASGREINTTKSADVISVIRNSLGIKSGREGFITDMLLRGRDIGRYELTEMASALGIPITLFGNQFSAKLGPEETLRQLIAILSSATQTGLNPRTAATGTRRMVEKTTRLMKSPEGMGKNLTTALRSMGFSSISEALNQGPMAFLETISRLTGGSPEALTHMGYGSRDIMLLTSALRNNMGQTREFYGKLAPGEIGGTTDKYLDKHKQTWWYQRDRLRSAYEDSQLKLMEAMIPVLSSFANSLEVVNDLFQALAPSIKRLIGLMTIGAGFSILRNFYERYAGGKFGAQGSDNLMKNLPVMGAGTPRTADDYGLRKINVADYNAKQIRLAKEKGFSLSQNNGFYYSNRDKSGRFVAATPTRNRYSRRATNGQFVPRDYDIRDWRGGIVPPSMMGSPVQQGGLGRRGAMYASASRFFGRASDNLRGFGEGYGKAKGWLKDSWLVKGGAFAFGGNEYRLNSIQKRYDERIEAANKAFVSGKAGAERGADWMRDTARQSGVNPVAASRIAAQHFNSTMDQVTKNFNKATASAANTAKWMGRLSGVMSGFGSVANMVAIGAVIQLLSEFIDNLNSPRPATKSGGVIDLSKAGKLHSTGMLNPGNMWGNVINAAGLVGTNVGVLFDRLSGGERDVSEEVVGGIHERALKKGRIAEEDLSFAKDLETIFELVRIIPIFGGYLNAAMFENMSTRKATLSDSLERALRENFSPLEQRQLRFAGYGKMTPELQRSFEEFALSGKLGNKYEGITDKDFGQRTNIPGRNPKETGYDLQTEFLTSFLRSKDVEQKVTEVTTKRIAEMGKAAEEAGKTVINWKDVMSGRSEANPMYDYSGRYMNYKRGTDVIKSRGELFDMQALRNMSPYDVQMWNSQTYRDMMKKAVADFPQGEDSLNPFRRKDHMNLWKYNLEKKSYEATGDVANKEIRDKDKVFGKYGDAANDFFKAAQDERRIGQLAQLLPMLSGMDPTTAKRALTNIYGDDLRLDEKGIDYLRNIDLSKYFSVKPYDKLGDRPQFATVGSVEGYNSMISMTTPEVEELQAIRDAVKNLNDIISEDDKQTRRLFENDFQDYVKTHLEKIANNTGKMAGDVPLSTEQPNFDNP